MTSIWTQLDQLIDALSAFVHDAMDQDAAQRPRLDRAQTIMVAELGITRSTPQDEIERRLRRALGAAQ